MADAYGTLARCLSVGILNSFLTFYTYFCISMSFTCFCIRWQLQLYLVSHDFEWIGKFELVSDFQETSTTAVERQGLTQNRIYCNKSLHRKNVSFLGNCLLFLI